VARAQLEAGQINQATTTLEKLIGEDPNYADAYDVMGRAHLSWAVSTRLWRPTKWRRR